MRSYWMGWLSLCVGWATAWAQHGTNGVAWAQADGQAAQLTLSRGLRLSVWAAEPQLSNGVAFHVDDRGRIYIAESHRWARSVFDITQRTNWLLNDLSFRTVEDRVAFLRSQFDAMDPDYLTRDSELVRRLEDRDGDGRAEVSEVVATGFNTPGDGTAAGVLATSGGIYFTDIPNLWRLEEGPAGVKREVLATGFGVHVGVSGHDLHGLAMGPDGRIYFSVGDRGLHVTNREGRVIDLPDTGGVLRCERDGSGLELFCIGLRNPQELAFDDAGELWTVDNDTAGADPCRVLHLVRDADYGWRCSYQHQEGFGPWVGEELWRGGRDNILPLSGTVSQGPSGLAFYPGTGWGEGLRGTFLHCDFPGGVWAFTVRPRGASFEVERREKFLWNCWPTDVDFGPDGAAYVLDWVAGWGQPMKGRIYRIVPGTNLPPAEVERVAEVKRVLGEGFGARSPKDLLRMLSHADRRLRLGAQFELARRGASSVRPLMSVASGDASAVARRHAVWGLGQVLRERPAGDPLAAEVLSDVAGLLADTDEGVRGAVAELLGDGGYVPASGVLAMMTDDRSARIRFQSAMALGSLMRATSRTDVTGARRAADVLRSRGRDTWAMALETGAELLPGWSATEALLRGEGAKDPFLVHAVVRHWVAAERRSPGKSGMPSGELLRRVRSADADVRMAAVLTLRKLESPALTNFLSDADPRVVEAAGRAIHDVPVSAGMGALAGLITRVDVPAGLHSRIIDAAFRLGTSNHALMLAGFAKRRDVRAVSRAEALKALGEWAKPPVLDRVNGLWRPGFLSGRGDGGGGLAADLGRSIGYEEAMAAKRNGEAARRAFLKVADEILNPMTPDERGVVVPGEAAPVEVRIALVRTAAALRTKEAAQPLFEHMQGTNAPGVLRATIVEFLAGVGAMQGAEAVRLALADADAGVRAAALPHLDRLEGAEALPVLKRLLNPGSPVGVMQAAYRALAKLGEPAADTVLGDAMDRLLDGTLPAEFNLDVLEAAEAVAARNPRLKEQRERWLAALSTDDVWGRLALRGGDRVRGGTIFRHHPQVQCLRCHKVGGDGGTVGPTLDGIGGKRNRESLLESIVYPNRAYAEGYRPAEGGQSAMPEGLAQLLTTSELRDLIEFLATLR